MITCSEGLRMQKKFHSLGPKSTRNAMSDLYQYIFERVFFLRQSPNTNNKCTVKQNTGNKDACLTRRR